MEAVYGPCPHCGESVDYRWTARAGATSFDAAKARYVCFTPHENAVYVHRHEGDGPAVADGFNDALVRRSTTCSFCGRLADAWWPAQAGATSFDKGTCMYACFAPDESVLYVHESDDGGGRQG